MSFKNFFERSIRGWLPEEPKMPKSKLKRIRTPIATLLVATTVFSLFSSVFMFNQPAVLLPPPLIAQSTPNSSYVEFKGILQQNNSFILILTNGTHISSKNLTMTFSITEKSRNECTAHITIECDGFSNEASVEGSIVDGNLVIDSTRSIFLINPNVTRKQKIVLTETDDWKLTATVDTRTGKTSTAIDPYRVTALMVSSSMSRTETGWPINVHLGYDPTTGILVYSGYSLSDVLLKEIGIELLLGGGLKLVSYSENLNLEVVNLPPPGSMSSVRFVLFILLVSLPVILPVAAVVVYIIRKKRKRTQVAALNILELHDNTTQNCDKRGW